MVLDYSQWRRFNDVIERAKVACENSRNRIEEHFAEVGKTIEMPQNAQKEILDFELSRYACYLIVMNGDSRKDVIAIGQTYFAVKTRQQELIEDYENLDEEQKRLAIRNEMKLHNKSLADAAKNAGVALGKSLRLKVIQGQAESVTTDGVFIFLTVRNKANLKRKENLMNNWLKGTQMEKFDQICRGIYLIFEKYDIKYPTIKVMYMTSRWGSCQPKRGIITLNSKLIEVPRNSIEYVVLHEFAHLIPEGAKEGAG